MSKDRLFQAVHRCSTHHAGKGYYVGVDGRILRLHTSTEMAALLKVYVGKRVRFRISGFADGTHCKMAAVIY